ncbi:MAG TPA: chemotaxis protein CheW [Verrucomicrobiae bacterium]|nr:chemotaxis protein CheW [Verrucomicrobiae bacterium]
MTIEPMTATVAAPTNASAAALAGKYLTFQLGEEGYGFPILRVREIIRHVIPTLLPGLPRHVKGVINLRGKVIPVVDLRLKFGFPAAASGERACIVVLQLESSSTGARTMGVIVDGVEEVIQVSASEIEEAPDFGAGLETEYILGMAKIRGTVKTLLDVDQVLTAGNLDRLQDHSSSETTVA